MSIWTKIWSWFLKHVWPQVEKLIIKLLEDAFRKLWEKIQEWLWRESSEQAHDYSKRAEEEYRKAGEAKDRSEAERHMRMAEIWHKVAFDHIRKAADLEEKLAGIMKEQEQRSTMRARSLTPDSVFQDFDEDSVTLNPRFTSELDLTLETTMEMIQRRRELAAKSIEERLAVLDDAARSAEQRVLALQESEPDQIPLPDGGGVMVDPQKRDRE